MHARHTAMHPYGGFSISDDDFSFDYNISSDDDDAVVEAAVVEVI